MTTPDDATPDVPDPTGMRALLRALPDPGPMPEDVVQRIHTSLRELPPLGDDPLRAPLGHDAESDAAAAFPGVSRGTAMPVRRSWLARHGAQAAVAAVVLVAGGAVATESLGLFGSGNDSMTASSDSAGSQAGTSSGPEAAQKAAGDSGTDTGGDTGMKVADGAVLGPIVVRHSGRAYTATQLATQLDISPSAPPAIPLTAESPGIGPIGTEIGVRSCLGALGLPRDSAADVDLASLDGTPAAVLVVTLEGERTAYAVGRDCTTGHPSLLAGPLTLP